MDSDTLDYVEIMSDDKQPLPVKTVNPHAKPLGGTTSPSRHTTRAGSAVGSGEGMLSSIKANKMIIIIFIIVIVATIIISYFIYKKPKPREQLRQYPTRSQQVYTRVPKYHSTVSSIPQKIDEVNEVNEVSEINEINGANEDIDESDSDLNVDAAEFVDSDSDAVEEINEDQPQQEENDEVNKENHTTHKKTCEQLLKSGSYCKNHVYQNGYCKRHYK